MMCKVSQSGLQEKSRCLCLEVSVPICNNEIINIIPSSHRSVTKINNCETLKYCIMMSAT